MRSLAGDVDAGALLTLDLREARMRQTFGELVDRPATGGGHLVGEGVDAVAVEEADDEHSARSHHPAQLGQGVVEAGWFQVDQRVPGEGADDGPVAERERRQRSEDEAAERLGGAGVVEELRHRIDTDGVGAEGSEVPGEVTRTAADVERETRPAQVSTDEVEVVGVHVADVGEEVDVLLSGLAVGTSHLVHIGTLRSGRWMACLVAAPSISSGCVMLERVSIIGLDHVQLAMPAGGEDRAAAFYEGVLGIPRVPKPPHLAVRGGCWFEAGSLKVHLGVDANFRPATKAHPAFLVDDVRGLARAAAAAGFSVVDDEPLEGYDRVYVDDPFGNRIELMEPLGE